jgi:signal transduction histidine kinase
MLVLGASAVSVLYQVEIKQEQIRQAYVSRDRTLGQLRSSIYLSGTYVRDFLLDPSNPPSPLHEAQFQLMRQQIGASLLECAREMPPGDATLQDVRRVVGEYLTEASSVFTWTHDQRARRSYEFSYGELLPKRMQALGLADQLRQLSERQVELSSQAVSALLTSYRVRLIALSVLALALGAALAGTTLHRILRLEKESNARLEETTRAREELTRLSADLVAAQENERRNISRELHDEVGQTLYATILGLGNVRSSLEANQKEEVLRELQVVNKLTERTAGAVRNMALLLRPAMLDDLGLLPALQWLAREATRTQTIPVEVSAEDMPEELPDDQVTCVYRIVQESVHNAEKHSHARLVRVDLRNTTDGLTVRVADDGRGFQPGRDTGLGILGMQERASQLGGAVTIESEAGRGTTVVLQLPSPLQTNQGSSPLRTA